MIVGLIHWSTHFVLFKAHQFDSRSMDSSKVSRILSLPIIFIFALCFTIGLKGFAKLACSQWTDYLNWPIRAVPLKTLLCMICCVFNHCLIKRIIFRILRLLNKYLLLFSIRNWLFPNFLPEILKKTYFCSKILTSIVISIQIVNLIQPIRIAFVTGQWEATFRLANQKRTWFLTRGK